MRPSSRGGRPPWPPFIPHWLVTGSEKSMPKATKGRVRVVMAHFRTLHFQHTFGGYTRPLSTVPKVELIPRVEVEPVRSGASFEHPCTIRAWLRVRCRRRLENDEEREVAGRGARSFRLQTYYSEQQTFFENLETISSGSSAVPLHNDRRRKMYCKT